MIEHVTDLLGPYLDGELGGLRLRQVEDHLKKCKACRKELDDLRSLSGLLQETVLPEAFTPTERFAADLALKLPRRPETAPSRNFNEVIWWLVPAGAASVWILLQAIPIVRMLVIAAGATGLLGSASSWIPGGPWQSLWFSASMNLIGNHLGGTGQTLLAILNATSLFWTSITVQLIWQIGSGLLILGWLAAWLTHLRTSGMANLPQAGSHL